MEPNLKHAMEFITHLRHSQLLEWSELDRLLAEAAHDRKTRTPEGLAAWFVARGALTQFQADRLLAGRSGDLLTGPYVIKEIVGSGDLGPIYRAVAKVGGKESALRLIPRRNLAKAVKARRFVRVFERVPHPAVVRFTDVGTAGNYHYLAWEFVRVESLFDRVCTDGVLAPGVAARYIAEAAEGMAACHEQGLIHGLLGPASLGIDAEDRVKILDGGIGALLAESDGESLLKSQVAADQLIHGIDYASPEGLLEPDRVNSASDIYSLGCTLHFCLTGRFPFTGAVLEKLQAHQSEAPIPVDRLNPNVPEELGQIVAKMLAKNPADRYASMLEVAESLQPFIAQRPRAVARPTPLPTPKSARTPMAAPPVVTIVEPVSVSSVTPGPVPGVSQRPLVDTSPVEVEADDSLPLGEPVGEVNPRWVLLLAAATLGTVIGWLLRWQVLAVIPTGP